MRGGKSVVGHKRGVKDACATRGHVFLAFTHHFTLSPCQSIVENQTLLLEINLAVIDPSILDTYHTQECCFSSCDTTYFQGCESEMKFKE